MFARFGLDGSELVRLGALIFTMGLVLEAWTLLAGPGVVSSPGMVGVAGAFAFWAVLMLVFVMGFDGIVGRDDLSNDRKTLWIVTVFSLPLVGFLAYMISRPRANVQDGATTAGHPDDNSRMASGVRAH